MNVRSMLNSAASWVLRSSRAQRMFWQSLIVALVFYLSRTYTNDLAASLGSAGVSTQALHLTAFLVIFVLVVGVLRALLHLGEKVELEIAQERDTKAHAHILCERTLLNEIEKIEKRTGALSSDDEVSTCLVSIRALVENAYLTFESAYGQSDRNLERIDFEVTFMSRSFRDRYITIVAAANKGNREPKSLQLRLSQPDIYERTVSADIYRSPSPRITIIPSTSASAYNELYPDQKRRIRSSVVLPVLTPSNKLLGTLVAHCDREGFFRADKEKYLSDLLEIFATRLAREVALIVSAVNASKGTLKPY